MSMLFTIEQFDEYEIEDVVCYLLSDVHKKYINYWTDKRRIKSVLSSHNIPKDRYWKFRYDEKTKEYVTCKNTYTRSHAFIEKQWCEDNIMKPEYHILHNKYVTTDKCNSSSQKIDNNKIDGEKNHIIMLFNNNVKGVKICLEGRNTKHCGKEGHWLEMKMGIKHNKNNEPDINGYEMKKSSNKITLGDFSASEYAFSGKNKRNVINIMNTWTDDTKISRNEFIRIFGNSNPKKKNRYSWSGICVPTYNIWNTNGQILTINENNDIIIYYSFSNDKRSIKTKFPSFLQNDNIVIAVWMSYKMKLHINNKFNKKGFFMCKKICDVYEKICFGRAFNYEYFISCIKDKKIIFDSGMYEGNNRNYSHFRGSCFWNELIIEEY